MLERQTVFSSLAGSLLSLRTDLEWGKRAAAEYYRHPGLELLKPPLIVVEASGASLDIIQGWQLHWLSRLWNGEGDNEMPKVTFVSSRGGTRTVDVPVGVSVLQAALNHRIEGILGECGGNCMCATCHVYVHAEFLAKLPPLTANEKSMLSIAAEGPEANSRLSCQIKVHADLEGLTVRIPSRQR